MKTISATQAKLSMPLIAGCLLIFLATQASAQDHSQHSRPAAPAEKAAPSSAKQDQVATQARADVPQVEMTPEQQKLIGVKTVTAGMIPMTKVIRTVGRIEADESRLATVNAKIEGWVEKLYVDKTGSFVSKGAKLAEIYSPELIATQKEFLTALKWVKETTVGSAGGKQEASSELKKMMASDANATLEAARQRLLLWDISADQIQRIEESGQPMRTLTLYAPVSGYVTQKMVVAGMRIMPGEKMFDLADLSSLWLIADIYEYELPFIRIGSPAVVTLSYLPGAEMISRVDFIYPTVSAETRTVKIRLKLANRHHQLKPQMFGNVEMKVNMGRKLAIPESAVMDTGKAMVVYLDLGNGAFEPREIKTGIRTGGYVEVLRGLKSGEKVVTAANFLLDSEAQLKGIKPLPSR